MAERRPYRREALYPVRVAATVSLETHTALCEYADTHERSFAGVVREAVQRGLKAMQRDAVMGRDREVPGA